MRWTTVMLAAAAWALAPAARASGEEAAMPGHEGTTTTHGGEGAGPPGTQEIDNALVTVVRIRLAPHQKVPMHEVSARVVVWLTDAELRLTFSDGSTRELHQKAGDTAWLERQVHAGENVGARPLELIAVVPRAAAASPAGSAP